MIEDTFVLLIGLQCAVEVGEVTEDQAESAKRWIESAQECMSTYDWDGQEFLTRYLTIGDGQ